MRFFFMIIALHFIIGGFGIFLLNRKLDAEARKRNWRKYVFYLLIFIIVFTSILINKNAFLGISIIILSLGLLELLTVAKYPCRSVSRDRTIFISLALLSALTFFFSLFILLPSVWIAYTYTIVVIFDGACQISGHAFGKRKILPVLSPGKTFEGLIGGTISAVITSAVLHQVTEISFIRGLFFGLLICSASFLGDLGASAFKRAFNTKDFGFILPGQGGMLDRFDSFIASGALVGIVGFLLSNNQIDRNIAVYLGYSLVFTFILLLGELLHSVLKMRVEYSRVFSHVMAGLACLFMIKLFTSIWYVIAICLQSAMFLFVTKEMDLFASHHRVKRKTYGSSVFFFGILISFLIFELKSEPGLFIIPVAVLSISDPLASLTGLKRKTGFWPSWLCGKTSSKTFLGSFWFFMSAFVIIFAGLSFFYTFSNWQLIFFSLLLSILSAFAELISPTGTDNISIPLVLSLSLMAFTR